MVDDLTRKTADVARHYAKERKYWIEKLSGQPPRTIFPYDEEMQEEGSEERLTAREEFAITGELYTRLMQVSTGSDPTLHIILTAALTLLLSKYGGQRDIVLGTPVYKQEEDAEYVNTALALRTTITPGDTFKQLLLKVKDAVLEADENQNYPLETLAGDLELNATAGGDFPLFDVTLLLENIHDKDYLRHIRHNLMFIFARTEESLQVELAYNPSRYHAATIKQVARHLENHLNKILFELDIPIVALDVLSDEERKHYLEDYNATQEAFPADKQLHQLFEEQVAADPEKIALVGSGSGKSETAAPNKPVDEQLTLTYGELNRKANRLAHTLRERGVGAETIVGIMAERSVDMVVAILGVLKSGGAYLPIAPGFPAARKQYMIEDSAIGHLLSQSHMEEKTKELVTGKLQGQILYLDKAETYSENETNPGSTGTPASAGNIIYTSGSTVERKSGLF
ncbi:MAG: AMP-binding protein [bacterium]|nr:AMP-binding protein [bacterium]